MDIEDTGLTGWRALLGREHRSAITVLAGGVLVFATNVYLTTSLLPSAIGDIGGQRLYAWVMTVFLLSAVIASLFVTRLLARHGARRAYLLGFGLYALGSAVAALAPTMPVLLIGRGVQGLGGGLVSGLAFAVIRQTLPESLWSRGLGAISAMWGLGNLIGPTVGGLFAQLGQWRLAFAVLGLGALALALVASRSMRAARTELEVAPLPVPAVVAVVGAAGLVSVAGVVHSWWPAPLLVGAALALVAFVRRERRSAARILPAITYRAGNPLKWVYLSLALLAIGSTVETFLPLFGQELGRLGPFFAGLLGAALSFGWSVGSIWASGVDGPAARARLRVIGPGLLALGLAGYALLQRDAASAGIVLAWAATLLVGGAGIGMAFQHGVTAAMAATPDPDEATRAATGVTTVQMMSNALGSALAGLLVNLGGPSAVGSARLLLWTMVVVALVGLVTARRANRRLSGDRRPASVDRRSGERAGVSG